MCDKCSNSIGKIKIEHKKFFRKHKQNFHNFELFRLKMKGKTAISLFCTIVLNNFY